MNIHEINVDLDAAKRRAFRILERCPKTEKQLKEKLISDGRYSEEIINTVLAFLKEYKYIDDRQFALDYLNSRLNNKGLKLVLFELKNKGISEALLDDLKHEYSDYDASEAIRRLIQKKGIDPMNCDRKDRDRLYRFLLSKGFSYPDIAGFFTL